MFVHIPAVAHVSDMDCKSMFSQLRCIVDMLVGLHHNVLCVADTDHRLVILESVSWSDLVPHQTCLAELEAGEDSGVGQLQRRWGPDE